MSKNLLFSVRKVLMQIMWLAFRPKLPKQSAVWLHLGCGRVDKPGFINIDGYPRRHVHYIRPIDDLAPFKDGSVDFIYVSHALEHFSHRDVKRVLGEWCRVLKPKGALCISVPDFEKLVAIYQAGGGDLDQILAPLMGGQEYKYDFHFNAFDEKRLTQLFLESGFSSVRPWTPGEDAMHDFDDWSRREFFVGGKGFPVSLNLEATK